MQCFNSFSHDYDQTSDKKQCEGGKDNWEGGNWEIEGGKEDLFSIQSIISEKAWQDHEARSYTGSSVRK